MPLQRYGDGGVRSMSNNKTPMFVDVRPSAKTLGVGEKWLRAEIKAGRVPGIQIGNRFKVNLALYIEQLNSKGVIR